MRLPRYQIGALQVLAEDGRESVDAMLTRMFEELADLNHERLARFIPGIAEAIAWPDAHESARACQVLDSPRSSTDRVAAQRRLSRRRSSAMSRIASSRRLASDASAHTRSVLALSESSTTQSTSEVIRDVLTPL